MDKEKQVALDILQYLHKVYYGSDKEDLEYRFHYGTNGVINKVTAYIQEKYIRKED